uniref:Uncharacterized protein n=1 Tax=Meleagris gallopavo TaxID=9103 RepID=A0A803YNT5_MELGA
MQSMFAGDVASPELPSHPAPLPECNSEIVFKLWRQRTGRPRKDGRTNVHRNEN